MKGRMCNAEYLRLLKNRKRMFQTSGKPGNPDYEIDLITLKKRPKKKVVNSTPKYKVNDIVNVNKPVKSTAKHEDGNGMSELKVNLNRLELSMNKKFDELEGVLKVISQDTKKTNSDLLNELKANSQKKQKQHQQEHLESNPSETTTIQVKREDLERFLEQTKRNKARQEEEYFRAVRAVERSFPRSRSLEKQNFFTPINENLIKNIAKRGTFPSLESPTQHDDLLFPGIPKRDDNSIHEFMIIAPNDAKPIITKENPLGSAYHRPDLVSLINKLGSSHDKYWTTILKHEKELWNLIAIEGYGENSVLIFERHTSKEELQKLKRKKWLRYVYGVSITGIVLYLLGDYFERDSNRPLIKKTIEDSD